MKRLCAIMVSVAMALSMTACGGQDVVREKTDTSTVAIGAVLVVRDDIPESEVYDLTSSIFEDTSALSRLHAKGNELSLMIASSITSVPYHPGAAKYFAEKGYEVEEVKKGAGQGSTRDLGFGTGGESGTYYDYGQVLASFISTQNSFNVSANVSEGSKSNLEALDDDRIQIAFTQSDVMSYAYSGQRMFSSPIEGFSVVANLYMEQLQIVTTKGSITSVADLKGKKISIGEKGSGTYYNALDVLETYGISENDIKPVYQSFGDAVETLKDGRISAAFIVAGIPTKAITELAKSKTVYLVDIDAEHCDQLIEESPYYSQFTIPKDTY